MRLERSQDRVLLQVPNQRCQCWCVAPRPERRACGALVAQPLFYPDLTLVASLPMAAALADWEAESRSSLMLAMLLLGLMVCGAGCLAQSYLHRMTLARLAMAESKNTLDQALESMVSGFVLLDAGRRVLQTGVLKKFSVAGAVDWLARAVR